MHSADVSPRQGHDALVSPNVIPASAPSHLTLFSQYRGPHIYNMAEGDPDDKDPEKQDNMRKLKERAEREEKARKEVEAENERLRKEKAERDEADRKAQEAKLQEEKKWEELAAQREAEAKKAADEAAAERKLREEREAELNEFKAAQQKELDDLLAALPDAVKKDLPIDESMTVPQKLRIVKHAQASRGPKPPVGGGFRHGGDSKTDQERYKELLKKPFRTRDEAEELAELTGKIEE
jgi:seryl-tRNA synthetase